MIHSVPMNAITLDASLIQAIRGPVDQNFRGLEDQFGVRIAARGDQVHVSPEEGTSPDQVQLVVSLLTQLADLHRAGWKVRVPDIKTAIRMLSQDPSINLKDHFLKGSIKTSSRKTIVPKSVHQREYIQAIEKNDLVFGIGPAGTGKTYLAVAMGVARLHEGSVKRILLTRPAVEAGERLGFLPGDIAAKIDPYLRPLYDALYDMLEPERAEQLIERGVIEVAPLAFMRGRTLSKSFVILDEAQNTTSEQMKMFLTRIGFDSKAVVTGDVTQVDLPNDRRSGLIEAQQILRKIHGLKFIHFDDQDVVRHPLVKKIIKAYDQKSGQEKSSSTSTDLSTEEATLAQNRATSGEER